MARSRPYKRKGAWYIDYTDENGVRRRLATDATTQGAAKILLGEMIAKVERIKFGLDAAPVRTRMSLWELCSWWLERRCPPRSHKREKSRLEVHIQRSELGQLDLQEVSSEQLESYFTSMEKGGAAPGAINRLRAILRCVFNAARKKNAGPIWTGANPVLETGVRSVVRGVHPTVQLEEVRRLLMRVPLQWRGFFAVAIYLALRKGEICGLKKQNVDLKNRVLWVAHSYENESPKGDEILSLPIIPELYPYLEEAMANSPSEYVFPKPDGSPRNAADTPEKRLRSALKRAGIVDGYSHTCRRCGVERAPGGEKGGTRPNRFAALAQHTEDHADGAPRRCPQCRGKLWAEGKPRGNMRFHDLRHSTATILMRCGVPLYLIQRVLRHANIKTTIDTYGHLNLDDIRKALAETFSSETGAKNPSGPLAPGQEELLGVTKSLLAMLGPSGKARIAEMLDLPRVAPITPALKLVNEGTNRAQNLVAEKEREGAC